MTSNRFSFRTLVSLLAFFSALLSLSGTAVAATETSVVISQVYGGGGNSGATYKNDFIELFNQTASPVSVAGWSVQYASSTGTSWQVTTLPTLTLQPGQYLLLQEAAERLLVDERQPRVVGVGRMWAAVLAYGGSRVAVLSHLSAAAVWDLVPWPSTADVTVAERRRSIGGVRVHRSRSLSRDDRTLDPEHGLPVTTVARTLIDLADVLSPHRLERICHRAEHLRLLDISSSPPGRRAARRLRAALATLTHAPPQITRSDLEERFLALVASAGLPRPRVNEDRGPSCADFLWPELNLVVETDGARTHNTDTAFHADRRRDVDLKVAGLETVRFTWDHIQNDPRWVERALRTLTASPSLRRA